MLRRLRNTKAFTLIELMIILIILGLIASVIIPKIVGVGSNDPVEIEQPIAPANNPSENQNSNPPIQDMDDGY